MVKIRRKRTATGPAVRRNPLHVDIISDERILPSDPKQIIKQKRRDRMLKKDPSYFTRNARDMEDRIDDALVDSATTSKILKIAEDQRREEDEDRLAGSLLDDLNHQSPVSLSAGDDNEQISGCAIDDYVDLDAGDAALLEMDEQEVDNYELNRRRVGAGAIKETQTLADIIMAKIREKEAKEQAGETGEEGAGALSPKVIEVYTAIGVYMSRYRSGKIPKALKIIPKLTNWEEILYLTNPVKWTANAMHEATKIFSSNFNPFMAQRFYYLVLLPAVREDIMANKKLNFHYYEALKKAFYKPSAWFKGILLPLVIEDCTLREAVIFGSLLSKMTIPPIHSAAALIRLCGLHGGDPRSWSAPVSHLIAVLLNKKHALPVTAISAAVDHFYAFLSVDTVGCSIDEKKGKKEQQPSGLPVVWHRALLTLVQRYKMDLTDEHKKKIRDLLRVHFHHAIGPEIRRELQSAL